MDQAITANNDDDPRSSEPAADLFHTGNRGINQLVLQSQNPQLLSKLLGTAPPPSSS
ncbi:hypothetical protein GCM10017709_24220 [Glutamicibacter nicotianae]|uniref:Uncharacterized protein n=1 Tax=Glutamicibacter nicotianae TaxID=37929 RepID=A0ABQ0RQH2_GLUNI|nr:hypothetical protein ANI01nite_32700 [Glutamicibacter nicotianae]